MARIGLCFRAEWSTTVTNIALSQEPAVSEPPGMAADLKMLAHWISLGACAGGLAGLLVGGIGGRIAMLLLRFTSDDSIRGLESDDGFIMGRFTLGGTLSLLLVTTVLGSVGGIIVAAGRPFFAPGFARIGWALAAGAIVGSIIVRSDGVDFTLLDPKVLAIGMFVGIPAAGAGLITWLMSRWEAWWWTDRKRTLVAAVPGLPALIVLPLDIAVATVGITWVSALRIEGVRSLGGWLPVRVLALAVFALLTGLGVVALARDVIGIL